MREMPWAEVKAASHTIIPSNQIDASAKKWSCRLNMVGYPKKYVRRIMETRYLSLEEKESD